MCMFIPRGKEVFSPLFQTTLYNPKYIPGYKTCSFHATLTRHALYLSTCVYTHGMYLKYKYQLTRNRNLRKNVTMNIGVFTFN